MMLSLRNGFLEASCLVILATLSCPAQKNVLSGSQNTKVAPSHHCFQGQAVASIAEGSSGCVLGISHSSIPIPGHMGTFDLLSSFCGAVCPAQGTHITQKRGKFSKFSDGSYCKCLSGSRG